MRPAATESPTRRLRATDPTMSVNIRTIRRDWGRDSAIGLPPEYDKNRGLQAFRILVGVVNGYRAAILRPERLGPSHCRCAALRSIQETHGIQLIVRQYWRHWLVAALVL